MKIGSNVIEWIHCQIKLRSEVNSLPTNFYIVQQSHLWQKFTVYECWLIIQITMVSVDYYLIGMFSIWIEGGQTIIPFPCPENKNFFRFAQIFNLSLNPPANEISNIFKLSKHGISRE